MYILSPAPLSSLLNSSPENIAGSLKYWKIGLETYLFVVQNYKERPLLNWDWQLSQAGGVGPHMQTKSAPVEEWARWLKSLLMVLFGFF